MGKALAKVTAQDPQTAEVIKSHTAALAEYSSPEAYSFVLVDDADLEIAAGIINDLKVRQADVKAKKEEGTKPAAETLRVIRGWWSPLEKGLEECGKRWRDMVRDALARRALESKAVNVALQAALDEGDTEEVSAIIQAAPPAATKIAGLTIVTDWDWEEFRHELVPAQFTVTSPQLVLAEIRRQVDEGVTEPCIGGMRIFRHDQVKGTG